MPASHGFLVKPSYTWGMHRTPVSVPAGYASSYKLIAGKRLRFRHSRFFLLHTRHIDLEADTVPSPNLKLIILSLFLFLFLSLSSHPLYTPSRDIKACVRTQPPKFMQGSPKWI